MQHLHTQHQDEHARKHSGKETKARNPMPAPCTQGNRHVNTQRKETNACKHGTSQ
jgi:hypothetical protein